MCLSLSIPSLARAICIYEIIIWALWMACRWMNGYHVAFSHTKRDSLKQRWNYDSQKALLHPTLTRQSGTKRSERWRNQSCIEEHLLGKSICAIFYSPLSWRITCNAPEWRTSVDGIRILVNLLVVLCSSSCMSFVPSLVGLEESSSQCSVLQEIIPPMNGEGCEMSLRYGWWQRRGLAIS